MLAQQAKNTDQLTTEKIERTDQKASKKNTAKKKSCKSALKTNSVRIKKLNHRKIIAQRKQIAVNY